MYLTLIQNVSLLIAVIALYESAGRISREKKIPRSLLNGLLFGGTAILGMSMPFRYDAGIIYDGRSIILTLAGLFGDGMTATIAALLAGAFRFLKGGSGVWAGTATILSSVAVGVALRRISRQKPMNLPLPTLYGVGILTHLLMLICQLLIIPFPSGVTIIRRIWPPILLIFPIAFTFAARILQNLERHQHNAEELKNWESIFKYAGWSVAIVEPQTLIVKAGNPAFITMFNISEAVFSEKRIVELAESEEAFKDCIKLAEERGSCSFECRFMGSNGSFFPALVDVRAHRETDGRLAFYAVNIRNITEIKEAERNILRRTELLNALHETSRQLASILELEKVMQAATDSVIDILGLQSAAVYLLQDYQLRLGAASPPLPPDFPDELRLASLNDHPHIRKALAEASPILLPDAEKAELTPAEQQVCSRRGLRTILYLPLYSAQEVLGVLIVGSIGSPVQIDETELDVCRILANYISLAIVNARLYESLRQHAAELEEAVARRTAQLEEKNRELEAFSYSISHDLRAPLRAVKGFAEIILRRHRSALNDEAAHYFDNILESAEYMSQLIADLLSYSRLGRGGVSLKSVSLYELTSEIEEEFGPRCREIGARIVIQSDLPNVIAAPTLLRQALTNLIDNALKYRREHVPATVIISGSCNGEWGEIRISDNGIGISPEFHQKIFEIFQRLHSRDRYDGTGIGLAMVKKAVEMMGGQVFVESVPEQGSTFIIRLPAA